MQQCLLLVCNFYSKLVHSFFTFSNHKDLVILVQEHRIANSDLLIMVKDKLWNYLAINEWGSVGYEELCRSRRVLSVDNTLQDLHNSLYPTKAEFINYFIIQFLVQNTS